MTNAQWAILCKFMLLMLRAVLAPRNPAAQLELSSLETELRRGAYGPVTEESAGRI